MVVAIKKQSDRSIRCRLHMGIAETTSLAQQNNLIAERASLNIITHVTIACLTKGSELRPDIWENPSELETIKEHIRKRVKGTGGELIGAMRFLACSFVHSLLHHRIA